MILVLDTRSATVRFGLIRPKGEQRHRSYTIARPEAILRALERFLKSERVTLWRVRQVTVVLGPGRFSFVRAGVVIGNALALANRLTTRGVRARSEDHQLAKAALLKRSESRKWLRPWYGKKPSITTSRTRKK